MDDDEDDYGDIADEDLMEAESFSQPSQTLPTFRSPRPAKRRRVSNDSIESDYSGNEGEGGNNNNKRPKYRIHIAEKDVPAAKIIGATQAEALPDSSPWRERGPIYKISRPEPPTRPPTFSATPRRPVPPVADFFQKRNSAPSQGHDYSRELEDLPSDAFSSPDNDVTSRKPITIGSSPVRCSQGGSFRSQRLIAPQQGLRQTTLFGGRAPDEVSASQAKKVYNFIADKPPEAPTHHKLDQEALQTWVYPTNLGTIRDYQYSIVKHGLFNNLLVALPTGLGKTFIAATIMLNFFRWTKDAQIVFVAPTKPLVAQQVDACFNIVGIPRSQTTMLTGDQPPPLRAEEWECKRVFFMTPQTLQNDLATGIADPKRIALLVVDEAHRATGNYAYCTVVSFLRRFNKSFRVLALTATPGASVEAVQEVIDNLEISKVEIRTEDSIDIQQYVHQRNIDQIVLEPSDEMIMIKDLFSKALQPLVNILCSQNAFYSKDPMSLTPFGMLQARKKWMADTGRTANMGLKGMMNALFAVLGSIAHSIKLLNFHGIGPFYQAIKEFRTGVEEKSKPSKYKSQITESPDFKKMMERIQLWLSKDDFVGHPKLTCLCESVLNHFLDAGAGRLGDDAPPSSTRVIVFAEYRDSAEDIVRVLNRHGPMIRASVFVGQADSKRSEGMNQIKQQEAINRFKAGKMNVLVATSIGEEGLDIGQVDLIVCYDASASPIRMLQRMGRTGRKRAGHIVLLLMKGKEEQAFVSAKDNYEQMQKMISSGARFNFRHDLSVRILPRDITPVVDKRLIDIPIENTQNPALPEPKRQTRRGKKMPAKKFHMPDGVETGFRKASNLDGGGRARTDLGVSVKHKAAPKTQQDDLAPILSPKSVFLTPAEERLFMDKFINVGDDECQEVSAPSMTLHPIAQRSLGPAIHVPHSQRTRRCVELFSILANSQKIEDRYASPYGDTEPSRSFWDPRYLVEDELKVAKTAGKTKAPAKSGAALARKKAPAKQKPEQSHVISDIESEGDETDLESSTRRRAPYGSISGDDSEGQGDEINSEEPSEDEDSDLGSLKDFLADGSSPRKSRMVGSSTTPPPNTGPAEKPFFVPTQSTIELSSDDEMPDVQTLIEKKLKRVSKPPIDLDSDSGENEDDDEEDLGPVQPQRKQKQRAVVESDSDE
ncbi:3'-5' DNA helicase [Cadophora gregata]|uniref:3'-5' DNA helicase n=1 Tax=Cadophora gregata TaxID=51156 RepID=UPI0026DB97FA|nr:3'-5' DNA helicase [Cadophora gregata]KAK0126423.1 3'-5' DNA helicase [Cadophora gregata]